MSAERLPIQHVGDVDWPWMASIDAHATMLAAATLLAELEVGVLGVVDNGRLVGVIGERDIVRACSDDADLQATPVTSYMSQQPATIEVDADIADAAAKMAAARVRHLPVVDGTTVVGMVSARDLLVAITSKTNGAEGRARHAGALRSLRRGPQVSQAS